MVDARARLFFMAKEKSENDNKCVFWLINLTVWRGDNVLVIVNLQRGVRPISREPFQQTLIFLSFPPWFFLICINRKHSGKKRKIVVLNWTKLDWKIGESFRITLSHGSCHRWTSDFCLPPESRFQQKEVSLSLLLVLLLLLSLLSLLLLLVSLLWLLPPPGISFHQQGLHSNYPYMHHI